MIDPRRSTPVETRYAPILFLVDVARFSHLPQEPGIYIIRHRKKLYCGTSYNIKRRVPESVRKQKFGRAIYFYPAAFINSFSAIDHAGQLKDIEARCISALYTIIRGNGLPFGLTNHQHVKILPQSAWIKEDASEFTLPLDIVQTILHDNSVPYPLFSLPHRSLFNTDLPLFLRKNIGREWQFIVAQERERRRAVGDSSGLLHILEFGKFPSFQ